jgi:hypothetical protein
MSSAPARTHVTAAMPVSDSMTTMSGVSGLSKRRTSITSQALNPFGE